MYIRIYKYESLYSFHTSQIANYFLRLIDIEFDLDRISFHSILTLHNSNNNLSDDLYNHVEQFSCNWFKFLDDKTRLKRNSPFRCFIEFFKLLSLAGNLISTTLLSGILADAVNVFFFVKQNGLVKFCYMKKFLVVALQKPIEENFYKMELHSS